MLLQSNINNTRSDVAHLIRVLVEISRGIDERLRTGGEGERQAFAARVKSEAGLLNEAIAAAGLGAGTP